MTGQNEYKSFKELRDAFFNYTRAERNGIYVLVVILILVGTYKLIDKFYWMSGPSYTPIEQKVDSSKITKEEVATQKTKYFPFDPNTVSKEEMLLLGFKEKAIKTFMNYRSTGAKFKNVADFERVYSIHKEDIERLREYIQFASDKKNIPTKKKAFKTPEIKEKKAPALFYFDPNTATEAELSRLGLSNKVVKTMLKFRKRGSFRKTSDLAKIYGLSDEQFEQLLPFIKIKPKERPVYTPKKNYRDTIADQSYIKHKKPSYAKDTVAYKSIDINKATNEEWQRINGIGPTYAKMINNFRGKLGGFYQVEQIAETYGLPDSVFQKIVPYVKESSPPFKIPINQIPIDSLAKHPYLTWKQARVVINYRTHHGPYKGPNDIAKVKIFTKEKWESIVPYLDYRVEVDTINSGE